MAVQGPILLIEDDLNDADVIAAAITELGVKNELKLFSAQDALDYLTVTTDRPFLILSDIRMPGLDGLALLKQIHCTEYLRKKAIPFIFYTGIVTRDIINEAYDIGVQGFYKKADHFTAIKDQLLSILVYWRQCLHPNHDNII